MPPVTGIVLAGGESSRFGRPKWKARLAGKTLLERAAGVLLSWCDEVLVVGRAGVLADVASLGKQARFVEDLPLGRGPLVGVATGLEASRGGLSAVVACDMPFADAGLLQYLSRLARGYDAVIPQVEGQAQPLHAVYHRRCLGPMKAALASGVRAPTDFLRDGGLRVRYVPHDELRARTSEPEPFLSVNSVRDLRRARDRLRRWNAAQRT